MTKYYLQPTIKKISEYSFYFHNWEIKIIPIIFILFFSFIIYLIRKKLNQLRLLTLLFIGVVIIFAQQISDFYLGNSLFDIQSNWHYLAYTIFSYLMYRYLKYRKMDSTKIIAVIFLTATLISTTDETLQLNLTNRIFDISDIVKDMLGAVLGIIFVFFVYENGKIIEKGWKIKHRKLKDYFRNPLSLLFLEFLFTLIFLYFSSILTEKTVRINSIFISLFVFVVIFLFIHFSANKIIRFFLVFLIFAQIISFLVFMHKNIIYNSRFLTIYKGIPIPYFDLMIFENGMFRLVDKKTFFNSRDKERICSYADDILLLGSGEEGKGGKGFPKNEVMQFYVNKVKKKILQVITLRNQEAVPLFNDLKKQNKKVVFILHHE